MHAAQSGLPCTFWVRGSECQGGPMKTGMQPARKASVRRCELWLLPGRIRQKVESAMCSSTLRCCCVAKMFCSNSRPVQRTCCHAMGLFKTGCHACPNSNHAVD